VKCKRENGKTKLKINFDDIPHVAGLTFGRQAHVTTAKNYAKINPAIH
jgi:hypothetical protein